MQPDIRRVSSDILTLLDLVKRPIRVDEFHYFLDEPYYVINMTLACLIRAGRVFRESRDAKTYITKVVVPGREHAICLN